MMVSQYGNHDPPHRRVDMFTLAELKVIAAALVVQEKSVNRLAAKDGQPENVAVEYRKTSAAIQQVIRKVIGEVDKLVQVQIVEESKGGKK